jgi:phospholipid/cholesterol/gamma-HCH transport system permease protein
MAGTTTRQEAASIAIHGDGDRLALEGVLDIHSVDRARAALGSWLQRRKERSLDLGRLHGLDTPGAMFLCDLRDRQVELTDVRAEHRELLDLVCGLERKPLAKPKPIPRWREFVMRIGKGAEDFVRDSHDVIAFVGRSAEALLGVLFRPWRLRPASISRQISETGLNALPIVGLMAIMIAIVIGYQGIAQLRPYGAQIFTINLVAVSVLREMGVLITAIIVAGRSGSAFTAEIGVMKSREEIDALEAMGLGPMELLVIPRLLGILITLPLLTFYADIMGLVGGAMISQSLLHMPPLPYIEHVRLAASTDDLFVGLIKAPIFAFFIGAVGCMHGLRVRGSAESVGRETTRAVVKGIFLVIIFDALFSVLFEKLGI